MKSIIRQPTHSDIEHLSLHIRSIDKLEATVMSRMTVKDALYYSVGSSEELWAAHVEGAAAAIFGLSQIAPGVAAPWMLGTEAVDRHPRDVLEIARMFIPRWNRKYPLLFNYIHSDNQRTQRWLCWAGFESGSRHVFGGHEFITYKRILKCASQP